MLSNIGKGGRLAATVLSAALSVTLVSPASAVVPPNAPVGTQDFASNGKADKIYGSGSDTTFPMHQAFGVLFNRAPGCTLQHPTSNLQDFDMKCDEDMNLLPGVAARTGFANYDRDLSSDFYFIGSGGGRNHVRDWNGGLTGVVQADYFRSSSSGAPTDGRSIAFARDALAAFTFDEVKIGGNVVDTPGKSIASLTQAQVVSIWQGNTKCWATIDRSLSKLPSVADGSNADYVTATNFDEAKWATQVTAALAGSGYTATSDAYLACNPMAVYTVPQTSGTAQAWNSLAAGGSSSSVKSEDFLAKVDPMTGAIFTTAEATERKIPENNASPIANRLNTPGINTDVTTNAIYFYSVGKYTTALGGLVGGNPQLSGNSTKLDGFKDRLFNVIRTGASVPVLATRANIESTSSSTNYLYARSLFFGYQYPNQATRNFLDPINGFVCTTATDGMKDPINSFDVRDQIEDAILGAGFFPFSVGTAVSGQTGQSYCRQATPVEDSTSPTAGFGINTSTDGASGSRPIFTITFDELVSGVTADTVGIKEFDGTALTGSNIPSSIVCTNARQAVIPCLAKTSSSNYDLSPLEFVKKVTVQPVSNLTATKSYKAFAAGTSTGQVVEIQDRSGLSDWPIIDGNPLVTASSAAHLATAAPGKLAQALPSVPATAVAGGTVTFSRFTDEDLVVTATSSTPSICTVARGNSRTNNNSFVVTGVIGGACKISLAQAGNDTYAAVPATEVSITVNKQTQAAPTVGTKVAVKKSITFSKFTNRGLTVTATTSTPTICSVKVVGNNISVTGVKVGSCKVTLTQAGNATFAALPSTVRTISVTAK